jgi:galactose-1-phosphate uridylyltransferase
MENDNSIQKKKDEHVRNALAKSEHPYFGKFQKVRTGKINVGGVEREYRLFFREDPFGTHTCSISEARARRPIDTGKITSEIIPVDRCIFDPPGLGDGTPEPKLMHDKPNLKPGAWQVVSVPNMYPFSLEHYVTIFSSHKPYLRQLDLDDMVAYINSMYDLADKFRRDGGLGIWDIINWGLAAGASQSHPHAQRGPIIEEMMGMKSDLLDSIKESKLVGELAYQLKGKDPYDYYLEQIRQSDLFIWETKDEDDRLDKEGGILIHAPFAPRFPHQVDIVAKGKVGNVLQLKREEREKMAKCMLGVFHALTDKLQVTDLNVVSHQELFHLSERSFYRMHWHVMPRNLNKPGGIEVGEGFFIVPYFPEETADVLREHYGKK